MFNKPQTARAIKVFYSYAHEDDELKTQLVKHLKIYEHLGVITTWHDRKIVAGQDWHNEINKHLNEADIILLLFSADFLASSYCYSVEMVRALERHNAGEAHTIPIILRSCNWEATDFVKLQALPRDAKPVTAWSNLDEAFKSVALGIREAIELKYGFTKMEDDKQIVTRLTKAEIPPLMPYLCDRAEQKEDLEDKFQYPLDNRSQRPFICFIHGHEDECHDKYKEQMQVEVLPDILKPINTGDLPIEPIFLEFPKNYNTPQEFIKKFRRELADRVMRDWSGTDKAIAEILSKRKAPVMTHAYPRIKSWESDGPEIVKAYVNYWNDFPELPPGPRLINCLFFIYKGDESDDIARRFLNDFDFSSYPNTHTITLKELNAVACEDVEDWFRDDRPFTGFCDNHPFSFCRIQEAIEDLGSIYTSSKYRTPKDEIPMKFLAKEVKQVLERNRC